jgi:hypothetical protein
MRVRLMLGPRPERVEPAGAVALEAAEDLRPAEALRGERLNPVQVLDSVPDGCARRLAVAPIA